MASLPDPPFCAECGEAGRTVYLLLVVTRGPIWLCVPCWSRPAGEPQSRRKGDSPGRLAGNVTVS